MYRLSDQEQYFKNSVPEGLTITPELALGLEPSWPSTWTSHVHYSSKVDVGLAFISVQDQFLI